MEPRWLGPCIRVFRQRNRGTRRVPPDRLEEVARAQFRQLSPAMMEHIKQALDRPPAAFLELEVDNFLEEMLEKACIYQEEKKINLSLHQNLDRFLGEGDKYAVLPRHSEYLTRTLGGPLYQEFLAPVLLQVIVSFHGHGRGAPGNEHIEAFVPSFQEVIRGLRRVLVLALLDAPCFMPSWKKPQGVLFQRSLGTFAGKDRDSKYLKAREYYPGHLVGARGVEPLDPENPEVKVDGPCTFFPSKVAHCPRLQGARRRRNIGARESP